MAENKTLPHSPGPAGGWRSLQGFVQIFGESWSSPRAAIALAKLNKAKRLPQNNRLTLGALKILILG